MLSENLITSETYNRDEISVEDAISKDIEFMQEVPEGYNAKNWEIKVHFEDKNTYVISTFGDGEMEED